MGGELGEELSIDEGRGWEDATLVYNTGKSITCFYLLLTHFCIRRHCTDKDLSTHSTPSAQFPLYPAIPLLIVSPHTLPHPKIPRPRRSLPLGLIPPPTPPDGLITLITSHHLITPPSPSPPYLPSTTAEPHTHTCQPPPANAPRLIARQVPRRSVSFSSLPT